MSREKLGEALTFNLVSKIIQPLFQILTSVLIIRVVGVDLYGAYLFVIVFFGVVSPLYELGLDAALMRYASEYIATNNPGKIRTLTVNVLKYKCIAWLLLSFSIIILWHIIYPDTVMAAVYMSLYYLAGSFGTTFSTVLETFYEVKNIVLIGIVATFLRFALIVSVVFLMPTVEMLIMVGIVPVSLTSILLYFKVRERLHVIPEGIHEDAGRIVKYSLSTMAQSIADAVLVNRSEVIFIGTYGTKSDVAIYGTSYSLSQRFLTFFQGFLGGLGYIAMTKIYVQNPSRLREEIARMTKFIFLFNIPILFWLFINARFLMLLLYGSVMLDAVTPFRILLLIMLSSLISYPLKVIISASEKMATYTAISWVFVVVNIALDISLISRYGLYGAILAVAIALLSQRAVLFLWIKRSFGNFIPGRSIGKCLIATIPMIILLSITQPLFQEVSVHGVSLLAVLSLIGVISYVFFIRIMRVVSEEDKKALEKLNIPIAKYVLKCV